MRVLLDQGLPLSATMRLTETGAYARHVSQVDLSHASDIDILHYADQNGLTCVTLDADFHALLAVQGAKKPSVIRIRQEGLKGPELANLLLSIWPKIDAAIASGAMVTITENAMRIRRLPILSDD